MAQPGSLEDWNSKNAALEKAVALRDAQLAQDQRERDMQPVRPVYQSAVDPTTGLLKDQFQIKPDLKLNTQGLDEIRKRALSTGPSDAANRLTDVQRLEEAGTRDRFGNQSASAAAQARASLASRAGLSAGASERVARQNARDQMFGNQQIGMQGAQQRAGILASDEQQKNQMLQGLPQMELSAMQPDLANKKIQQENIDNSLSENRFASGQNLDAYNAQMQAWAAQKQSQAIQNSGGGGKK